MSLLYNYKNIKLTLFTLHINVTVGVVRCVWPSLKTFIGPSSIVIKASSQHAPGEGKEQEKRQTW